MLHVHASGGRAESSEKTKYLLKQRRQEARAPPCPPTDLIARTDLKNAFAQAEKYGKGAVACVVKDMLAWYVGWPDLPNKPPAVPRVHDGNDGDLEVCLDPLRSADAVLYVTSEYAVLSRALTNFAPETTNYCDLPQNDIGFHLAAIAIEAYLEGFRPTL